MQYACLLLFQYTTPRHGKLASAYGTARRVSYSKKIVHIQCYGAEQNLIRSKKKEVCTFIIHLFILFYFILDYKCVNLFLLTAQRVTIVTDGA